MCPASLEAKLEKRTDGTRYGRFAARLNAARRPRLKGTCKTGRAFLAPPKGGTRPNRLASPETRAYRTQTARTRTPRHCSHPRPAQTVCKRAKVAPPKALQEGEGRAALAPPSAPRHDRPTLAASPAPRPLHPATRPHPPRGPCTPPKALQDARRKTNSERLNARTISEGFAGRTIPEGLNARTISEYYKPLIHTAMTPKSPLPELLRELHVICSTLYSASETSGLPERITLDNLYKSCSKAEMKNFIDTYLNLHGKVLKGINFGGLNYSELVRENKAVRICLPNYSFRAEFETLDSFNIMKSLIKVAKMEKSMTAAEIKEVSTFERKAEGGKTLCTLKLSEAERKHLVANARTFKNFVPIRTDGKIMVYSNGYVAAIKGMLTTLVKADDFQPNSEFSTDTISISELTPGAKNVVVREPSPAKDTAKMDFAKIAEVVGEIYSERQIHLEAANIIKYAKKIPSKHRNLNIYITITPNDIRLSNEFNSMVTTFKQKSNVDGEVKITIQARCAALIYPKCNTIILTNRYACFSKGLKYFCLSSASIESQRELGGKTVNLETFLEARTETSGTSAPAQKAESKPAAKPAPSPKKKPAEKPQIKPCTRTNKVAASGALSAAQIAAYLQSYLRI